MTVETPLRDDVFETIDRMHHRVVSEIQMNHKDQYDDIYSQENLDFLLKCAIHSGLADAAVEEEINRLVEDRVNFIRNRKNMEIEAMEVLTLDRKKEWATLLSEHGE